MCYRPTEDSQKPDAKELNAKAVVDRVKRSRSPTVLALRQIHARDSRLGFHPWRLTAMRMRDTKTRNLKTQIITNQQFVIIIIVISLEAQQRNCRYYWRFVVLRRLSRYIRTVWQWFCTRLHLRADRTLAGEAYPSTNTSVLERRPASLGHASCAVGSSGADQKQSRRYGRDQRSGSRVAWNLSGGRRQ